TAVGPVAVGKTTQRSGASIGRGTPPSESLQDRAVPGTTTVNRAGSGRPVPPLPAQRNFACVYPTATAQGGEASRSGERRAYHGTGLPPAVIARGGGRAAGGVEQDSHSPDPLNGYVLRGWTAGPARFEDRL